MNKAIVSAVLISSMTISLGCGSIRHHPVLYGIAAGAAVGVTVGIITRRANECPDRINGVPYNGTPYDGHCPEYWPDPGRKR